MTEVGKEIEDTNEWGSICVKQVRVTGRCFSFLSFFLITQLYVTWQELFLFFYFFFSKSNLSCLWWKLLSDLSTFMSPHELFNLLLSSCWKGVSKWLDWRIWQLINVSPHWWKSLQQTTRKMLIRFSVHMVWNRLQTNKQTNKLVRILTLSLFKSMRGGLFIGIKNYVLPARNDIQQLA